MKEGVRTFREKIKNAWQKLLHEDATPNKIAFGFSIGLFTAYFPMPVLDTLIALAVAYLVKANRASCLIGNNFVLLLFPIIPFIFGLEYFIGKKLLGLPHVPPLPEGWNLWHILYSQGPTYRAIVLGAIVLAVPSAIGSFIAVKIATTKWQKRRLDSIALNASSETK
jgi:uncharacterized protein (DUF2062 family)